MNLKERLQQYIEYKGITVQEFEKKACLSNGAVSKMGDNTRTNTLDKISIAFDDLSVNWLRTGEGSMLKDGAGEQGGGESHPSTTIDRLLDELAAQRKITQKAQEQVSKAQEQIDRLIGLLEDEKGAKPQKAVG